MFFEDIAEGDVKFEVKADEKNEEDEDEESEELDGDGGTLSTYSQLIARRHHDSKATWPESSSFARLYPRESTCIVLQLADQNRIGIRT